MEFINIWYIRNCMFFIFTCMKKIWLGLCFMEEKKYMYVSGIKSRDLYYIFDKFISNCSNRYR